MIPLSYYLWLSAALFIVGMVGVLVRRNALVVFMSIEMMLNAANLALLAFARHWGDVAGQVLVLFVLLVAAVEAVVGLAIIINAFRSRTTFDLDDLDLLKG